MQTEPYRLNLLPARDSTWGFSAYYLNLLVLVIAGVNAWVHPQLLPVLAAALCLALLFLQDIVWYKRCHFSRQDQALIEKLSAQLDDKQVQELLTECDFCQWSFSIFALEPLQEIDREWVGVDYEFSNPDYQQLFERFKAKLHQLLNLIHAQGKPYNAGVYYLYARKDKPNDTNFGPEANDIAAEVYGLYQAFRKIYIAKMPYIRKQ